MRIIKRRTIISVVIMVAFAFCIALFLENRVEKSRDQESITINQIRDVAKLATIEELVEARIIIDDEGKFAMSMPIPGTKKFYIAIAQGKVTAGIDMEKLKKVTIEKGTARIQLPQAEILYKSIDPSTKWEKEYSGIFTHVHPEEITKAQIKAEEEMVERAKKEGILEKANTNAKTILTNFLKTAGIERVIFE